MYQPTGNLTDALDRVIKRVAEEQDVMVALTAIFNAGRDFERERIINELAGTNSHFNRDGALSRYVNRKIERRGSD